MTCQAVSALASDNPMDQEDEDALMMTPFSFGAKEKVEEDINDQVREEETKIEYNSQLLLGDRGLIDWLQLFSQQLLSVIREKYKEVRSLVLTMAVPPRLKHASKGDQFKVMRELTKVLKEVI